MIAHLFQSVFRSARRNRLLTAINISGLALGFSSCILIVLYLADEFGYDQHHENLDRIYRVSTKLVSAGTVDNIAISASPLPEALKDNFPEVEEAIRVNSKGGGVVVQHHDAVMHEDNIYAADPGIFRIFSYKFIEGESRTALSHPDNVILTRSLAKKYFPDGNALGALLTIDRNQHQVSGVIEDVPRNSEIYFSMLLPLDTTNHKDWFDFSHYVFVMFSKHAMEDPTLLQRFQQKLDKLGQDYINGPMQKENPTLSLSMSVDPLKGLHFNNSLTYDTPKGNMSYVYIFASVAILILFIACINYINFSIVQSMEKSREVGIRKVVGSTFRQLVIRYISQSLVITMTSVALSIILVALILPEFSRVLGRTFQMEDIFRPEIMLTLFAIVIVTGILAGSYPAFYSSSIHTIKALKGETSSPAGKLIRKVTITIQFAVTLGLLISTYVIYAQMSFISHYDPGFRKDNVIAIKTPEDSAQFHKISAFKHELEQSDFLFKGISIAGDGGTPGDPEDEQRGSQPLKNGEGKIEVHMVNNTYVDEHYIDVLGIDVKLGRNFNGSPHDQENSIIVNEALVNVLGWKDPLSHTIRWGSKERTVIGVVGNVHYRSLYNPVEPQFFVPHQNRIVNVFIRLEHASTESIEAIQRAWHTHFPEEPFRYNFLDDTLQKQYGQEQTAFKILTYFSVLTVVISVIGMFGLSLLSTYQRKREIGIRKVIGAQFRHIAFMFARDYLLLIGIALIIICPVVWYVLDGWLNTFISHTSLSIHIFAYAALIFALVVLITILLSIRKIATLSSVDLMK